MRYECQKCGFCCTQNPAQEFLKRIPLYPEEALRIRATGKSAIELDLKEDLYLPDENNHQLYVFRYTINLDGKNCCVLRDDHGLCTQYIARPLACQAYPLSLKTQDAFNQLIILDLDCPAIRSKDEAYRNLDPKKLAEIFPKEYPVARRLLAREKTMQLALRLKAQELGIEGVIEWDRILANRSRWQEWTRVDVLPDD